MTKTAKALVFILLLSPMAVSAEAGDTHTVKADTAILRQAASKNSPQVEKLGRFSQVVEMDIRGEWYEVYVASSDQSGWMHSSTLALPDADNDADSAPKMTLSRSHMRPKRIVALKVKDSEKTPSMKNFEKYLLKYSARTQTLKGYTPFSEAEPLENGNLQVTATSAWLKLSKAMQKSSLIVLHTKWKKAINNSDSEVIVVDVSENRVLNYP